MNSYLKGRCAFPFVVSNNKVNNEEVPLGFNLFRSSHQRCSMKKNVLNNFAKFTGKHMHKSHFFNKVTGLRYSTLLKKRLWHRCLFADFAKTFKNTFFNRSNLRSF